MADTYEKTYNCFANDAGPWYTTAKHCDNKQVVKHVLEEYWPTFQIATWNWQIMNLNEYLVELTDP